MGLNLKKGLVVILCFWVNAISVFCQEDYSFVNEDKGKSYNTTTWENENITIPLYEVKINGNTIPIYLSHSTQGIKVGEIPSSVGFGWELHAGGQINKQINHLVDENEKGWLFSSRFAEYNSGIFMGNNSWETSVNKGKQLYSEVDSSPDFYRMKISNGDFLNYTFNNSKIKYPKIFKQSGGFYEENIHVSRELIEQYDYDYDKREYKDIIDSDIDVLNKNGILYKFRKGITRIVPYEVNREEYYDRNNLPLPKDSAEVRNYYLHRIENNKNNDYINFEYHNQSISKYTRHTKATRFEFEVEGQNGVPGYREKRTLGYDNSVSREDVSRKEIKIINTNKEKIEFLYKNVTYDYGLSLDYQRDIKPQELRLLDRINVYNKKGQLKFGFQFEYYQGINQGEPLKDDFRLKTIYRLGKNNKDLLFYKRIEYYRNQLDREGIQVSPLSMAKDVFGFPNGKDTNNNHLGQYLVFSEGVNVFPNENKLKDGMIKAIISKSGAVKKYNYILNKSNNVYYGGLLVDNLSVYNQANKLLKKTNYVYENPEGFGLPIFEQNYNSSLNYSEGFYDSEVMNASWQTYFTKKDPEMELKNLQNLTAYNVESVPYKLYKNTPALDALFEEVTGNKSDIMKQIEQGSFYRKVTAYKVNIRNNKKEKGAVEKYYTPSLNGFYLSKKLNKIVYLNNNEDWLREEIFNYSYTVKEIINTFNFENVHLQKDTRDPEIDLRRYVIKEKPVYIFKETLKEKIINEYEDHDNLIKSFKTNYTYNDLDEVKTIKKSINGELSKKTEFNYVRDFQASNDFTLFSGYLWNTNPVLEKNSWVNDGDNRWKLVGSEVLDFYQDGKTDKLKGITFNKETNNFYTENDFDGLHVNTTTKKLETEDTDDVLTMKYNSKGYLINSINEKLKLNTVYQRSDEYEGDYIDAVFVSNYLGNASDDHFTKMSFENSTDSDVVKSNYAFTGKYVFAGEELDLGGAPAGFEVSYWSYKDNKWSFNSFKHLGGTLIINKPTGIVFIDEVIVKPPLTTVTSFTYSSTGKTISKLDARGDGEFYEYDIFGRLIFIYDKDKNVLKEYKYNNVNK